MPIAQAAGPERQIASAEPSTAAGDQKAAAASRMNVHVTGALPPGLNIAASGGDGVNLGGPLVERSRLGSVAA